MTATNIPYQETPGVAQLMEGPVPNSRDKTLFVLRPRKSQRAMFVFVVSILLFISSFYLFVMHPQVTMPWALFLLVATMIGGFLVLPLALFMAELLLFQEIRLHTDRIAKSWEWIGTAEIELAHARLTNAAHVFGGMKTVCKQGTQRIQRPFKNISYLEGMFKKEDIETFHRILADLTGRQPGEFERATIDMKKLIKEAKP